MNNEILLALDLLEKEKNIPRDYMKEKIEMALLTAVKKDFNGAEDVKVTISDTTGDVKVYLRKKVVEEVLDPNCEISLEQAHTIGKKYMLDDTVEVEIKTKNFGRIAAQTAKQVIIQGIREAERDATHKEFESKHHEIITGVVRKIDPKTNAITVELPKAEAILMPNEQIAGEVYHEGDSIKVFVVDVRKGIKGTQIVISRSHPGFVRRLFEMEVPEVFDGTVEVKSISREAGSRTKVAVASADPNVDPIGACIGPKRVRISNMVEELNGEKIDLIRYSEDPLKFVAAAIAPAEVLNVEMIAEKTFRATVPEDQLSLAIGKEGQNVRLAARVTGLKIDIVCK